MTQEYKSQHTDQYSVTSNTYNIDSLSFHRCTNEVIKFPSEVNKYMSLIRLELILKGTIKAIKYVKVWHF